MKIESSKVAMSSSHSEYSYTHLESVTVNARASTDMYGAILNLSQEGGMSYKESIGELQKQQAEEAKKQQEKNWQETMNTLAKEQDRIKEANNGKSQFDPSEEYELKLQLLKMLFEMMSKGKIDKNSIRHLGNMDALDLRSKRYCVSPEEASKHMGQSLVAGTTSRSTVWQKITATSGTHSEYENSTFASKGLVQTSDGRTIDFNIEVTLGRAMTEEVNSISAETYLVTDPLIINMDTNATSVSDQKFMFDINSDGKEEKISFAGKGSGFLALDKNGDGKINDGSELFGTKSGDGFKDLAEYDEDHNGWIDENDDVFDKLMVWTKDESGNDILMSLKKADVGAIYLNSVDTQYTQKNLDGKADAILRKTGVYLKESTGQAGTVAHVDLVL